MEFIYSEPSSLVSNIMIKTGCLRKRYRFNTKFINQIYLFFINIKLIKTDSPGQIINMCLYKQLYIDNICLFLYTDHKLRIQRLCVLKC